MTSSVLAGCLLAICSFCSVRCSDVTVMASLQAFLVYSDEEDHRSKHHDEEETPNVVATKNKVNPKENNAHKPFGANLVSNISKIADFSDRVYIDSLNFINTGRRSIDNDLHFAFQSQYYEKLKTMLLNGNSNRKSNNDGSLLFKIAITANAILNDFIKKDASVGRKEKLLKSLDTLKGDHYAYICKKHHICRTTTLDLIDYLSDATSIVLLFTDPKLGEFFGVFFEFMQDVDFAPLMNNNQIKRFKYGCYSLSKDALSVLRLSTDRLHRMLLRKCLDNLSERHEYYNFLTFLKDNTSMDLNTSLVLDDTKKELVEWGYGYNKDLLGTLNKIHQNIRDLTVGGWNEDELDAARQLITELMGVYADVDAAVVERKTTTTTLTPIDK